jgi:hypothetical protein
MSKVSDPGEPPPPSFLLSISQYRLIKYWACIYCRRFVNRISLDSVRFHFSDFRHIELIFPLFYHYPMNYGPRVRLNNRMSIFSRFKCSSPISGLCVAVHVTLSVHILPALVLLWYCLLYF